MHRIHLRNVTPTQFKARSQSDIWNKDIEFTSGNIYEIIAPSGTGKTSFMHMMYALNFHYTGKVQCNDIELKQQDFDTISELRNKHISIQFQDIRLSNDLSCAENIHLKAQLNKSVSNEQIEDFAKQLGVNGFWHKKPQDCSQGEQQRVGLIRALSTNWNILLLDEPFSNLDPDNIEKAWRLIQSTMHEKAMIIITSLKKEGWLHADKEFRL